MNQIDTNWVAAHTKHRTLKGHKKTFGHVLVIAGSPEKVGSGILCARAALYAGGGHCCGNTIEIKFGSVRYYYESRKTRILD